MSKLGSVFEIEGGKRYRGVLTLKDEFGIPYRKYFSGADKKALQKRMRQYFEDCEGKRPKDDMSVQRVCEQAIEACRARGCAPKTLSGYDDFLRCHIGPNIGAVKITELQPGHVERMLGKMQGRGSSTQTQMLCGNFLRMAINRIAVKNSLVSFNAAALADPPKVKHRQRRTLEPADLEKILAVEDRPVLRAMWLFLASTGLRPGRSPNSSLGRPERARRRLLGESA